MLAGLLFIMGEYACKHPYSTLFDTLAAHGYGYYHMCVGSAYSETE